MEVCFLCGRGGYSEGTNPFFEEGGGGSAVTGSSKVQFLLSIL